MYYYLLYFMFQIIDKLGLYLTVCAINNNLPLNEGLSTKKKKKKQTILKYI